MKKLLLALLVVSGTAHATTSAARLAFYNRYFDCTFCGMMSLMPNQQIPQLQSLLIALAYYKKHQKDMPLVHSMPDETATIYHGIVARSGSREKELEQVMKLIGQKIQRLECSKKNEGKGAYDTVSEVITQRSSKHDQHRSSSTQKPKKK